MNKISVCVPCYNRPRMTEELMWSFLRQDYPNKELILVDDSPTDVVENVVKLGTYSGVRYSRNRETLGYDRNLGRALKLAEGSYIVILGDDDVLLKPNTLSRYVAAFEENPQVGYVYSNQIQFSATLRVEYQFTFFPKDTYYTKGRDAYQKIWCTSGYIPGIGLRNTGELLRYYPRDTMLFPQVELVGHVLGRNDAIGLSEHLIAGRAHEDQLGFKALRGQNVRGGEDESVVEYFDIFARLKAEYGLDFSDDFLREFFEKRYLISVPKQKLLIGAKSVKENYGKFRRAAKIERPSLRLTFAYAATMACPPALLSLVRRVALVALALRDARRFGHFQELLREAVEPPWAKVSAESAAAAK